jgi:hypothetical protein
MITWFAYSLMFVAGVLVYPNWVSFLAVILAYTAGALLLKQ